MTSGELLNKRFEKARMGGYKTTEVEAFLAQAATAFAELTRENTDLKRQMEALQAQAADMEADKDSLRDALLSAQKFADSLVHDAKEKADTLLAEAREKADRLANSAQIQIAQEKEELARIKTEVSTFRSRLLEVYRAHLELIGAMPVEKEDVLQNESSQMSAAPAEQEEKPAPAPQETVEEEKTTPPVAQSTPQDVTRTQAAAVTISAQQIKTEKGPQPAPQPPRSVSVRLNMRYDAQMGEYVPISEDGENE